MPPRKRVKKSVPKKPCDPKPSRQLPAAESTAAAAEEEEEEALASEFSDLKDIIDVPALAPAVTGEGGGGQMEAAARNSVEVEESNAQEEIVEEEEEEEEEETIIVVAEDVAVAMETAFESPMGENDALGRVTEGFVENGESLGVVSGREEAKEDMVDAAEDSGTVAANVSGLSAEEAAEKVVLMEVGAQEDAVEEKTLVGVAVTEANPSLNAKEGVGKNVGACEEQGMKCGETEAERGADEEDGAPLMVTGTGAEGSPTREVTSPVGLAEKTEVKGMGVVGPCYDTSGFEEVIDEVRELKHSNVDENFEQENEEGKEEDSDENGDEDQEHCWYIHDSQTSQTDSKKQKDIEIYVGGLNKGTVEEDLINVFGKFGEIKSIKIVARQGKRKRKGFAFIRYATPEQAKNVLSELKDGIEVRGKHVNVSASQDNGTLYMGNICKTWTKEHVLEALKGYGIEHIDYIHLPEDAKKEGKSKGFALLEFSTHPDAVVAFQRLRKPDAVFGRDRSAKVAFAQTPMHPSEEAALKVKTVYIEGLTDSWDEDKVKEICKQYGDIEGVKLSRNLGTKRKNYGFVTFTSRESALACIVGINSAQIGDGQVKVKANIAKPRNKGRFHKPGTRGGYKVEESSEKIVEPVLSEKKGRLKPKGVKRKERAVADEKGRVYRDCKGVESTDIEENPVSGGKDRKRKSLTSKDDAHSREDKYQDSRKRPKNKLQGNIQGKQYHAVKNPRSGPRVSGRPSSVASFNSYGSRYASGYGSSYHVSNNRAASGSTLRSADMEPHAGYLEPAVGQQRHTYAPYREPALRMQDQPPVYNKPAIGVQGYNLYDYRMRSIGSYNGCGSSYAGYGGGSAYPPSVRNYSGQALYESDEPGVSIAGYHHSGMSYRHRLFK